MSRECAEDENEEETDQGEQLNEERVENEERKMEIVKHECRDAKTESRRGYGRRRKSKMEENDGGLYRKR